MAHNVKIKYYARENTKMTPHSFYAQPIPNGLYGFERICELASKNTSIEAHTIRAAVEEYMKVAMEKLLDGFRVELGNNFVTLGPGLTAKVKDTLNQDGTVKKAATADDLSAVGAKSRVTAVVNSEFSHEFSRTVRWQKTDRHGNPLEPDEDDATQDPDDNGDDNTSNLNPQTSNPDNGSGDNGGGTPDPGVNEG